MDFNLERFFASRRQVCTQSVMDLILTLMQINKRELRFSLSAAIAAAVLIVPACTTEPTKVGDFSSFCKALEKKDYSHSLCWDYQYERFILSGSLSGGAIGALLGAGIDSMVGGSVGSIASSQSILVDAGLPLSAQDLNATIYSALTAKHQSKPQTSTVVPMSFAATQNNLGAIDSAPVAWPIAESNEGQIITEWKRIKGREGGILWWKKEYETEVRHIITVRSSFNSEHFSDFSIETEVHERANQNYPWSIADPELGRQSLQEIRSLLLDAVQSKMSSESQKSKEQNLNQPSSKVEPR